MSAKQSSRVFNTSLAASGDEMIKAETPPNCSCITGPCFFAKSLKEEWGGDPEPINWCRFPIRGSLLGPGGDFRIAPRALYLFQYATTKRKKKQVRSEVKDGNRNIMNIMDIVSLRISIQSFPFLRSREL